MQNAVVAALLDELADLLELQGANPFRVRAYRNAARTIENLPQSVADLCAQPHPNLTQFAGIGKDIAAKVEKLVCEGTLPQLEELRAEFPPDVLKMFRIPGLGPKKIAALIDQLQVRSLPELRTACEQGRIAKLKGFGAKTQQQILAGLEQVEQSDIRVLLPVAQDAAEAVMADMRQSSAIQHVEVAGSCRRLKESCGDLDLLAISSDPEAAMDRLAKHPLVEKVLARGDTKQRVRLYSGIELDLRVVPEESYGAAMQYFTGSKEHNIAVRKRAIERGLKINEYGVFRDDEYMAGRTEEDVYATIGLPWIPPELRENRGEIELAEQGRLPKLIEVADIQGDLHMHTTASDGRATIREMAEAARARGLKYIAITDHSKRVSMANGLDAQRLREHWKDIQTVRGQISGIEILCGIECDILEDACLDLDDGVLSEADWVIAVLHYGLKQPREQIQKRLRCALTNPHVDLIGHPSGRMVGTRPGADLVYEELFKMAADHGVMLEINANPNRLDLDDVHAAGAKAHGIPIVINTDSHSVNGFDVLPYGIHQARRAGLTAADVANARPWPEFKSLLDRRR